MCRRSIVYRECENEVILEGCLLQKPALERDVMNFNHDAAVFP